MLWNSFFCFFRNRTSLFELQSLPRVNVIVKIEAKGKIKKRKNFWLILLLLCNISVGYALDSVTLKLKWTHEFQFAGYYAAKELGYYREAGLDVKIKEAKPSDNVVEEILSNKADFGTGSSGLVLNRYKGQPVVVLGVIFQHSPYVLVARKDTPAPSIHDLVGKRVMIEPLAVELQAYLSREGIPPENYTKLEHSFHFEDLLNAKTDAMAAYVTSEPFFLQQAGASFQVFSPRSAGIDFYGDNLFTSEKQILEHPERVKAFREASFRGWQFAMAHPEVVIDIILTKYSQQHSREQLRFEADQMASLIQAHQVDIGYMYPGRWQHIADVYSELGMLPLGFSLSGFLYKPDPKLDLHWLYYWLTLSLIIAGFASGIAVYIYRINHRLNALLAQALESREQLSVLKTAIEQSPTSVIITNAQGLIEYVNPYFSSETGYSAEEVIGKPAGTLNASEANKLSRRELWRTLSKGRVWVGEFFSSRKSGETYWQEAHIAPVKNHEGNVTRYVGINLDVTSRKQWEATQKALQARLSYLLKSTPAIIYSALPCSSFATTFISENIRVQLGYRAESILEDPDFWSDRIHPDDRGAFFKGRGEDFRKQRRHAFEYRFQHQDGSYRWIHDEAVVVVDADNQPEEVVGYIIDITSQKKIEQDLVQSHKQLKQIIDNLFAYVALLDVKGAICEMNKSLLERGGCRREDVIGRLFCDTLWWSYDAGVKERLHDAMVQARSGAIIRYDEVVKMGSDLLPIDFQIGPITDTDGQIAGLIATAVDISNRKEAEATIFNLAFTDPLTGLHNRRMMLDRLGHALSASERSRQCGGLLFLDLDNFKSLNDTFGHAYGDLLLIEVSQRLVNCVREVDTVARLGGDEFVVLLEDISAHLEEAMQLVDQIAEKIRSNLSMAYDLQRNIHYISPSIGVCLFHGKQKSPDEILKCADMAMYQAKESGKNRIRFFDPSMQCMVETRAALESDLRQAIEQKNLYLAFQLQVDHNLNPIGAEALIRWDHPQRGVISPGQFIPIAEDSLLILEIGHWVLDCACRQLAIWKQDPKTRQLELSINVSAIQFKQKNFVDQVEAAVVTHRINPSLLKLELTESVALDKLECVTAKMNTLRESIGVKLSLDDFGTGYSSLSYLKRLPVNQIKIDQGFVRDVITDASDAVMVKTIIELAKNFDLDVIAEGVETCEHLAFLMGHGCKAFQGYLFSKPLRIEEFETLLLTPVEN